MANGFNTDNEGAGNPLVGCMDDSQMRVWVSESEKRLGPAQASHDAVYKNDAASKDSGHGCMKYYKAPNYLIIRLIMCLSLFQGPNRWTNLTEGSGHKITHKDW
jgi:hypothetical protein